MTRQDKLITIFLQRTHYYLQETFYLFTSSPLYLYRKHYLFDGFIVKKKYSRNYSLAFAARKASIASNR
ncbi:MAG: hypothetical protein K9K78_05290, partial [Spirochaetales bacterium]|nr:hypothetical protein [Spirochaetales bacterium]